MPAEFRFLVFTPEEAAVALATHARAIDKALPDGRVLKAEPTGERTIAGTLLIDTGGDRPANVPFDAAESLEAMIAYCIARRIPLPMASEKLLERLQGRFALRIGQVDSMEYMMRSHAPRARD